MLAGLQEIQRLEEHPAEPLQITQNLTMLGIIIERQLGGIVKRRVEVQLEPDLDHITGARLHIKRVVIETDFPRHDHVAEGLLGVKCLFET